MRKEVRCSLVWSNQQVLLVIFFCVLRYGKVVYVWSGVFTPSRKVVCASASCAFCVVASSTVRRRYFCRSRLCFFCWSWIVSPCVSSLSCWSGSSHHCRVRKKNVSRKSRYCVALVWWSCRLSSLGLMGFVASHLSVVCLWRTPCCRRAFVCGPRGIVEGSVASKCSTRSSVIV